MAVYERNDNIIIVIYYLIVFFFFFFFLDFFFFFFFFWEFLFFFLSFAILRPEKITKNKINAFCRSGRGLYFCHFLDN